MCVDFGGVYQIISTENTVILNLVLNPCVLCKTKDGCHPLPPPPFRLMLWDTAGQEEFDAITKAYYR
jgi:GTPase SAR1 family protein